VDIKTQLGGKGRAILTSSTSTQYSFEQEEAELSIYTRYLVEGIEKGAADTDGDGWISVDELHEYASSKVQEAAPAMTPKFYPVEEGYRILLAKALVDDPKVNYRKEVEVIAREDEGEISPINRTSLDELRNSLKLLPEEADTIESEVLEPYRQRKAKLQRYEQVFTEAIGQQYPLNERNRNGLKRLQHALRLRDEDVALIETRVVRQRRRFSTGQLLTRQKFLKLAGLGGAGVVVAVVFRTCKGDSPQPTPSPSKRATTGGLPLQVFKFNVVTVDARGKETNRNPKQAKFFTEDLGNGVRLEMVSIPDGTFLMGSPPGEPDRGADEGPQHTVTIKPFFIGKFQVTQAQWRAVAGFPKVKIDLNPDPSNFKGANRPVEQVSWYEAIEFCARLSQKTGQEYRLPSEAEWEYACRAGTTTPFHFGETITTDLANYCGEDRTNNEILYKGSYGNGPKGIYREQTTDVGSFPANAFGLYDMHGNVWEWCADRWHENYNGAPTDGTAWLTEDENDYRLLRGGSWSFNPWSCRSAHRYGYMSDFRYGNFGFRVGCVPA
jgi:formylglycine-generating enzyme required for sulfatase activity